MFIKLANCKFLNFKNYKTIKTILKTAIERVTVKDSSTIGKINLLADVCRANKAFADRNKLGLANKR